MDPNKANMEFEENDMENSFQKVYGWFIDVNRLTENDFTKHSVIYESNIMSVLNQLSYLINYGQEQEKRMKNAQNS